MATAARHRSLLPALAASLALAACAGDATTPDASLDGGAVADAADAAIAAPLPPAPPAMTPCPPGWRESTSAAGTTVCDPWPATGPRTDCPPGDAHFPGEPDCAHLGPACGADRWATDLPTGRPLIYIDSSAAPGGAGSRASPYHAITDLVAPPAGSVIALAQGTYAFPATVAFGDGITLWGACVEGTRVTCTVPALHAPVVLLMGRSASVRNLTIDHPARIGIGTTAPGTVVENVVVDGATELGVVTNGGDSTLRSVVVRDTQTLSDGSQGVGVWTQGTPMRVERSIIERSHAAGVACIDAGATLHMVGTVSRGTMGVGTAGGQGISAQGGCVADISQSALDGNSNVAVGVRSGSTATVTDVAVDGRDGSTTAAGVGANAAAATLSRVWVRSNVNIGLQATQGATMTASDVVLEGAIVDPFTADQGSTATIDRMRIESAGVAGLLFDGVGTSADLHDVSTTGTRVGMAFQAGARGSVTRALEDRPGSGVFVDGAGTTVDITDLLVRDATSTRLSSGYGEGVWAQDSSVVTLTESRIENAHFVGVASVFHATVGLSAVTVVGTRAPTCATTTCTAFSGAFGLAASFGGALTAQDFLVDGSDTCGVVVGAASVVTPGPSAMDLMSGVVTNAPVGACVQLEGFDSSRLTAGVQYRAVGVPLQSTTYALPDQLAPAM